VTESHTSTQIFQNLSPTMLYITSRQRQGIKYFTRWMG